VSGLLASVNNEKLLRWGSSSEDNFWLGDPVLKELTLFGVILL